MKKYTKFLPFLLLGLCLVLNSCSPEDSEVKTSGNDLQNEAIFTSNQILNKSSTSINDNIIMALDTSIKASINGVTDEELLGTIFMDNIIKNGVDTFAYDDLESHEYSSEFNEVSSLIMKTETFEKSEDYQMALQSKKGELNETLVNELEIIQATALLDFQIDLINYFNDIGSQYNTGNGQTTTNGWWSDWGKCAAGVIGGYLTGGALGCGAVGGVGALVGGAATAPIGGLPGVVVGGIAGCAIGGTIGAIGGALTGSAMFCD
jgi:hypothetical protein